MANTKQILNINTNNNKLPWVNWFCNLKGHEFFCKIDENFLQDKFNLIGLQEIIPNYLQAINIITNTEFLSQTESIKSEAFLLYGLIHARYILSTVGIECMLKKYEQYEFGTCPRVYCNGQNVLPISLSDIYGESTVKIYCPKCIDVYNPIDKHLNEIDGAYFSTNFPHMFFMVHPELRPKRPENSYIAKLFGFRIHNLAYKFQLKAAKNYKFVKNDKNSQC